MKLKIQAFGIVMILFGSPIIHFFRDFMGVLPKSPLIMPIFSVIFFIMILSFGHLKKIFLPNRNISIFAWCFLGYSMFMALITDQPIKSAIEAFNYLFLGIYFYLICGVNIKVSKVIIPIVVLVTLGDNLALLIAFIKNPFTQIGQRAIISDVGWGEGAGNPSLYSFMAFAGIIASLLILNHRRIIWKLIAVANISTSIVVILMTLIRATIFTGILCLAFYLVFNLKYFVKKPKLTKWYDFGISKSNFIVLSFLVVIGIASIFVLNKKVVESMYTYVEHSYNFASNVVETILAGGKGKKATADISAANRVTTFNYSMQLLTDNPIKMIYGYGYRFLYVDIPIIQVFLEEGLIGLFLILMFHYYVSKNVILAAQIANNKWIQFWIYYYILLIMNSVSRGQPYDPYFWNYFLTIARFMKSDYMVFSSEKDNKEQTLELAA
jgi:hypothetical protein